MPDEMPTESNRSQELLDAISSLGKRRILIVLDKGLMQFGKFVIAQVAIFGIIGIFFFGADIKDTLKEVRKTHSDSQKLTQELNNTLLELRNAKHNLQIGQNKFRAEMQSASDEVIELQKQVSKLKLEADLHLSSIRGLRNEAERHIVVIKELTVSERATFVRLTESDYKTITRIKNLPETASEIEKKQAEILHLWTNGATLRVKFLDGTKNEQEKVKKIACEWTKHANIEFNFIEYGDAHIRVTLRPKNSKTQWPAWSYHGTGHLGIDKGEPTIGLDITNELKMWGFSSEDETRGNILRQFGFALGLIDESRNLNTQIPWDTEALARYYGSRNPFSKLELPEYRNFDPKSVMFAGIPNTLTKGDFELKGQNYQLSDSDKRLIDRLYPSN
jgi:hypothetical protein